MGKMDDHIDDEDRVDPEGATIKEVQEKFGFETKHATRVALARIVAKFVKAYYPELSDRRAFVLAKNKDVQRAVRGLIEKSLATKSTNKSS